MKKRNWLYWSLIPTTVVALGVISGCNPTARETKSAQAPLIDNVAPNASNTSGSETSPSIAAAGDGEHGHIPGAHGGIMVSLGRDSYHVEAVIDSEGTVRLYTLGKDESRVIDVESQTLKGFVKADGDADSTAITFEPSPQEGDAQGKTSLFLGRLPQELVGLKLDVTIPNIRIDGERFRLGFVSGQTEHGESTEMPDKLADSEERELYLTAEGRYTADDIKANGNVTASQKFKGLKSAHDMKPEPGDQICPITQTKANPQFTWVVDGKSYQFCCPPCVDEFVKMAKSTSEPLPEPKSFVKQ